MVEQFLRSKRSSDSTKLTEPLKPPVFFIDRSLGSRKISEALRNEGHLVEIHAKHFRDDAPDEDWLQEVAKRRWLVLTSDKRIRYNNLALQAIYRFKAAVFVIYPKGMTAVSMAERFCQRAVDIQAFAEKNSPPYICQVSRGQQKMKLVWPKE
jgi:hypothetical protein